MKLYSAPNTCSLSPHIVLRELGLPFELVMVNNRTKVTADGADFLAINPKGYVAALQLDNGEVLTEGPAIVQYLADLRPEAALAPPPGSWPRVRLQEMLNYIGTEIHAGASPLFNAAIPDTVKVIFRERLVRRFDNIAGTLATQDHLLDDRFGVADAYLYAVLLWMPVLGIALDRWPAITAYIARIAARPAVQAAQHAEQAAAIG
ncbi:glutathione transferase GstA [Bradyrhizobium sp. U87765 SZCCT0131]|uniref:glutathione transferase GstA n=1 Tax=unclassified Bradyrhizobium TaxID=2631580 RepID=UPI001BAD5FEA|nr:MULTISPECIES: glutathione transferase GstA [unclassified Bradyrhizobium]MBR1220690.1 glutathione transferase GstA [Bradyrhizobium sp. U87765 SZCCT0131]MBR1262856.1 glutathione transferase GstA [Bradyrhizobium sp. U87765 SZCCT0134]MBR1307262.1 glutathione transferase GstA [Bradyrhizobium sp. U87765 SZCCT0110]MBR1322851.1 glutathione transferase GstA [Bradyrhizobium sp. U87765 SZCCT0109]MBR1346216.1 glutathione transferase GstA [Bradyrhizobium sp. U87765 SZCCT0048]